MRLVLNPDLSFWLTLHYPQAHAVLLNAAVHQTLPSPSLLFHCTQLTDAYPEQVKKQPFWIEHSFTLHLMLGKIGVDRLVLGAILCGGSTVSLIEPWVGE